MPGLFDSNDPQATAQFASTVGIAGSVMSVVGAFASAQAQKAQLEWQADVAAINAATAEGSARTALQMGQREEQALRLRTSQLKAGQEAGLAANGIDLGEGSAARVRASTDIMGEIDANALAANAVRTAFGYRTQGANYRSQAVMARGAAGAVNPLMSAGSTALTNAGLVAQQWYMMRNTRG